MFEHICLGMAGCRGSMPTVYHEGSPVSRSEQTKLITLAWYSASSTALWRLRFSIVLLRVRPM